jgi:hypothetical protein
MTGARTIGGLEAGFPRCVKCQTTMQVGAARCYFCGTPAQAPTRAAPASQPAPAAALTVSTGRVPADFLGGLLAGVGIVLVPLALRIAVG